jgi:non-heme chloroperoxidase
MGCRVVPVGSCRAACALTTIYEDTALNQPVEIIPADPGRRKLMLSSGLGAVGAVLAGGAHAVTANAKPAPPGAGAKRTGGYITARDGASLFFKDWGTGPAVVFSHGWPLNADSWENQMMHLASNGFRCIAHDRRGHGRSTQTWNGNDMDTYADDLAAVMEALDLREAMLVGFSTGGGEVVRYVGRHGTGRVAKLVLVGAVPPLMLKTPNNPNGVPKDVFDGMRAASLADRAQLYKDLAAGPFFGFNRPGAKASQGMMDTFWMQGMQAGHKNTYDCIKAFSETDLTEDLKKVDVPTLVIHGDADQVVPIEISGRRSAQLVKGAKLIVYEGAPHGITDTHKARLNDDLLAFAKA